MKVGVACFVADGAIHPAELGRAVEERELESLFLGEHTHMPGSRPPEKDSLPWFYYHSFDPFLALTAAAVTTERITLGTSISLLTERDPITTAKEISSLDHISGGRLEFGIGAGWSVEELANHGTDPAHRVAIMRDRVQAMKVIWTNEVAEYHGPYVNFTPLYQWPKPVRLPHPPILVGGTGPTTIERVLEFGDGWIPMAFDLDAMAGQIANLQKRAADAGRGHIPVTACAVPPTKEKLEHAAEIGVDRALCSFDTAPRDDSLAALDAIAAAVESASIS
jgi:probable F420-dependent oxidoreductase